MQYIVEEEYCEEKNPQIVVHKSTKLVHTYEYIPKHNIIKKVPYERTQRTHTGKITYTSNLTSLYAKTNQIVEEEPYEPKQPPIQIEREDTDDDEDSAEDEGEVVVHKTVPHRVNVVVCSDMAQAPGLPTMINSAHKNF
ncbi:hypothetical protein SARC_17502, partial [Sphaeroforma arctica JP610]